MVYSHSQLRDVLPKSHMGKRPTFGHRSGYCVTRSHVWTGNWNVPKFHGSRGWLYVLTELGKEMPTTYRPAPSLPRKHSFASSNLAKPCRNDRGWLTERDLWFRGTSGLQGSFQKCPVITLQTSLAILTFPVRWKKLSNSPETIDSFLGIVELHSWAFS